MTSRECYTGKI